MKNINYHKAVSLCAGSKASARSELQNIKYEKHSAIATNGFMAILANHPDFRDVEGYLDAKLATAMSTPELLSRNVTPLSSGIYPDVARLFLDTQIKPEIAHIEVNVNYLIKLLQALVPFTNDGKNNKVCIEFRGTNQPLRVYAEKSEYIHATGILMGIRE